MISSKMVHLPEEFLSVKEKSLKTFPIMRDGSKGKSTAMLKEEILSMGWGYNNTLVSIVT